VQQRPQNQHGFLAGVAKHRRMVLYHDRTGFLWPATTQKGIHRGDAEKAMQKRRCRKSES
jgi:hypothetical protein